MKIIKKITILFTIVICILLLKQTECFAMTQQEAGTYIASYAKNFVENHANETRYLNSGPYIKARALAYNLQKYEGYYTMDCCGFVNMVLHQSINLNLAGAETGDAAIVAPLCYGLDNQNGNFFDDLGSFPALQYDTSSLMPGDIIANYSHVFIYIGNNMIAECNNSNWGVPGCDIDTFQNEIDYYYTKRGYKEYRHYRIKAEVAEGISTGNAGGDLVPGSSGGGFFSDLWDSIEGFIGKLLGEDDDKYIIGEPISDKEYNNIYYKGIANEVGTRTEVVEDDDEGIIDFIFAKLTNIIDYLVGCIIYPIRASVTGFANIVQIAVSDYVATASGEQSNLQTDDGILTNLQQKMKDSLTLEKIVYNQVPALDVNIFNLDKAGGKDIKSDSLAGIIRSIVSNWYYLFRTITIIALLIILIYVGIKIAVTTVSSEKAKYKEFLVNWLISFIVIFAMPYLMIFVMQINEALVSIFAGMGKQLNLYETVRELTWSAKMSVGIIGTMLYITLVYYLVKFVVLYLKRLFVIVILIVIAPLVAGKYAYDKVRGGKGNNSLGKWVEEYIFSVMMQTVHALIYTVFISMTINIVKNSDSRYIISTMILSLIFFNFMTKSERIVKNIIKLNSNKSVSFGDADSNALHDLIGWSYIKKATGSKLIYKPMYNMTKSYLGRKITNNNSFLGRLAKFPENVYVEQQKEKLKKKYGAVPRRYKRNKGEEPDMYDDIDKQLDYAIRERYHMNIETVKSLGSTGVNLISGMSQAFIAIPQFVAESPVLGVETFLSGIETLKYAAGVPIEGYKKIGSQRFTSNSQTYKTMETLATGGVNKIIRNIVDVYGQKLDVLKNYKPEQIRLLYQSQQLTKELIGELEKLKGNEFKGYQKGSSLLEKKLAEQYQAKLEEHLRESQKTIEKEEIKEKIRRYEEEKKKISLGTRDLNNIAKRLQKINVESSKSNIIIRKEIEKNIKDQLSTGMINNITGIKDEYKNLTIDDASIDSMIDKIKERINKLNENGAPEDSKEKQAANLSLSLLEQKKSKDKKDVKNKVDFNNLSEEEQNGVKEVLKEAITEEDMNNTTQKMSLDDLAQLMKISVDTKGSIEKAPVPVKFGGVIEKAEELRKVNEKMKEITNKTIDEKGNLVKKEAEPIYQTEDLINMANKVIKSPNK